MASPDNRLARTIHQIEKVAGPFRQQAITLALGRTVKFVGTAGLKVEELTAERAVISVQNKRRVQNHIGGVHAMAMGLLAESATGFVIGMNVPDSAVPVIKSAKIDYLKRATGGLRAEATLSGEQRRLIAAEPKGEVLVQCRVTDDSGIEPIQCEMIWAWVPKKRD
jgi:acyl-coenzyme A thioesterase PaaI-like protein